MEADATRGDRNADWIEKYCLTPFGKDKGLPAFVSVETRKVLRKLYDNR